VTLGKWGLVATPAPISISGISDVPRLLAKPAAKRSVLTLEKG